MDEGQHVLSVRFLKAWHVTHQYEQGLCLTSYETRLQAQTRCVWHPTGGGEVMEQLPVFFCGLEATLYIGCSRWDRELRATNKTRHWVSA